MTMRVRATLIMIATVAMLVLSGCDHYNCGTGPVLGGSCTPSTPGLGGTGPTGSTSAAFVFVADAAGTGTTGTVDGYTLVTTASTFAPTSNYTAPATPLNDGGIGMVVAQAQFLYTAFPSTNQIFGWTIGTDGSLTAIAGSPFSATFLNSVSSGFTTQSIATNPSGTLLFIADTFQDSIYVYTIGSGGVLTLVAGSPFTIPFSPGNLSTDGLGKYLYITETFSNHTGSQIGAYAVGTTGALTVVPGSPFAFPMWQVQGEPTGQFLIGISGNSAAAAQGFSGTDDDHLYVFNITQQGTSAGAITQASGSPFPTSAVSPLNIAVQSNTGGNLVYAFGLQDQDLGFNAVEGYAISSTGALTAVNGSPFSNVQIGDQGAFDQSGALLFVYGGVFNSSTNTESFEMGAFDVGTGNLTQPTTTLTLTSGGFFAVTDPQ
jgi:hypothetical protein